jgi:hypothetical protein
MNRRTNLRLRRRVELLRHAVKTRRLSVREAAQQMDRVGAPFEVVCRVLVGVGRDSTTSR